MPLLRCLNLKNMNTFLTPNVNFNVNTIATTDLFIYFYVPTVLGEEKT